MHDPGVSLCSHIHAMNSHSILDGTPSVTAGDGISDVPTGSRPPTYRAMLIGPSRACPSSEARTVLRGVGVDSVQVSPLSRHGASSTGRPMTRLFPLSTLRPLPSRESERERALSSVSEHTLV